MKKLIAVILLVAFISPLSAMAFKADDDETRVRAIEIRLDSCEQNNQALATRVMQLENKVVMLEQKYDRMEEVVKTFQQQLINSYTIIINFIKSIKIKLNI